MVGDTLYTDIAFGNACGVRSRAANSAGPGGAARPPMASRSHSIPTHFPLDLRAI